jgi:hypothetical protein
MLFEVALRRLRRETPRMGVLLLAIGLVAAFLALGPLYVRSIARAEFEIQRETLQADDYKIEIQTTNQPLDEAAIFALYDSIFGAENVTAHKLSRLSESILGPGEGADFNNPRPIAFRDFDDLFTLTQGRLPAATPDDPAVEVLMTDSTFEQMRNLNPSYNEIDLPYTINMDGLNGPVNLTIVGLVTSNLPQDDPYWAPVREVIFGEILTGENFDYIFLSPITTREIFEAEIVPHIVPLYFAETSLQPGIVTASDLNQLDAQLSELESRVRDIHPTASVRTPLTGIIAHFQAGVRAAERPVIFLSMIVVVLMLYNLVTTIALILEGQKREWAIITSRGGSVRQLMTIHLISMGIIGLLAAVAGPVLAVGFLAVLSLVGPQADVLTLPALSDIPTNAVILSALAGVASVAVLMLPAYPIASAGLLTLKRSVSRPPEKPVWARFLLDFILLFIGLAFVVRLYLLVDTTGALNPLTDPTAFFDALSANPDLLSDPFNIAGPVLLIAGAALPG